MRQVKSNRPKCCRQGEVWARVRVFSKHPQPCTQGSSSHSARGGRGGGRVLVRSAFPAGPFPGAPRRSCSSCKKDPSCLVLRQRGGEPGRWLSRAGARARQFVPRRPPSASAFGEVWPPPAAVRRSVPGTRRCLRGPAGAAGSMESPFSPGLAPQPDDEWGERGRKVGGIPGVLGAVEQLRDAQSPDASGPAAGNSAGPLDRTRPDGAPRCPWRPPGVGLGCPWGTPRRGPRHVPGRPPGVVPCCPLETPQAWLSTCLLRSMIRDVTVDPAGSPQTSKPRQVGTTESPHRDPGANSDIAS